MRQKLSRVLALAAVAVMLFTACSKQADTSEEENSPKLKFATEGVTATDQDSLQKAVDEMNKPKETIGLYFKASALSSNGTDFTCYLGNSKSNNYNAFYALYADEELTDQIFLSDLIRPGEVFESITLNHASPKGTTLVYCALTLVEDDLETIHDQAVFTVDFTYQ